MAGIYFSYGFRENALSQNGCPRGKNSEEIKTATKNCHEKTPCPARKMRGHGVHASRSDDAAEGLLLRCCETLCNVVPVEDVPDSLDVIRLDVLVLQVESVLPHIQH